LRFRRGRKVAPNQELELGPRELLLTPKRPPVSTVEIVGPRAKSCRFTIEYNSSLLESGCAPVQGALPRWPRCRGRRKTRSENLTGRFIVSSAPGRSDGDTDR
jgi:hypothetical protein